ncbi:hypothetical protein [Candidatus Parabeggiatoa sp. HSG14]|uniref:hypothetical protein n=1 Tax=Candidatus Parabeggiatoa sp. HSG14 TaxID=3055593 RepID=UPI0025A6C8C8|nr:hypothetical protein [Thiotrichales bacterium HSG14]
MQNITLRSCVGADGNLQLNVPTALTNTELDVLIFLRPLNSSDSNKPKTFSERWRGKFKGIAHAKNNAEQDLRFEYLVERYKL